jgi:hypothetical protein
MTEGAPADPPAPNGGPPEAVASNGRPETGRRAGVAS